VVVIRMDKVPFVDQSGLYAMEDAINDLHALGIKVVFTDVHGQPRDIFERFNIYGTLVEEEYFFTDFRSCANWLEGYLKNGKR
jgi:SulP family sulfate permease